MTADLEEIRRSGLRFVQTTPLLSRAGALLGVISTHWRHLDEIKQGGQWYSLAAVVERFKAVWVQDRVARALGEPEHVGNGGASVVGSLRVKHALHG